MRYRKVLLGYFACCFFILVACSKDNVKSRNLNANPSPLTKEGELSTREVTEKIVFDEITERLSNANLKSLKERNPQLKTTEVRLWIGASLAPIQGIILEQKSGEWRGLYLEPTVRKETKFLLPRPLPAPKNGWNSFWKRLESLGIFTLPDAEEIGANSYYSDAPVLFIEISVNASYKNYMYVGFTTSENSASKKVKAMVETTLRQFNLKPISK